MTLYVSKPGLVPAGIGFAPDWHWLWRNAELMVLGLGNGGQLDLVTGQLGEPNGSITETVTLAGAGPDFGGNTDTEYVQFTGRSTDIGTKYTFASVSQTSVNNDYACTLGTSSVNNHVNFGIKSTGLFEITCGGVEEIVSNITVPTNVPVFMAASFDEDTNAVEFVLKNLATGQLFTDSTTSTAAHTSGDGKYHFGNGRLNQLLSWYGPVLMGGILLEALSLDALTKWADDPFGPFTPNDFPLHLWKAAAGGATVMNQFQGPNLGADLFNGTIL